MLYRQNSDIMGHKLQRNKWRGWIKLLSFVIFFLLKKGYRVEYDDTTQSRGLDFPAWYVVVLGEPHKSAVTFMSYNELSKVTAVFSQLQLFIRIMLSSSMSIQRMRIKCLFHCHLKLVPLWQPLSFCPTTMAHIAYKYRLLRAYSCISIVYQIW